MNPSTVGSEVESLVKPATAQGDDEHAWLIGVDVGGTFTDGVLVRPAEKPLVVKTATQVDEPVAGLLDCLDALARDAGVGRHEMLHRTKKFAYGTTQAANMVVEGKGASTGFITTKGFRDTLIIAGIGRDRIGQDLAVSRAPSLVPRRHIHEVSERVDRDGRILTPLSEQDVLDAIQKMASAGVESVGVCLLWSFKNPEHEYRIAEMIRSETDWYVTASADCAPVLGEYERSATTALNARLGPPLQRHLLSVEAQLRADGLAVRPLVMTSSGGLIPLPDAAERPVSLLSSGPAGGVLASRLLAEELGIDNVICGDMGGTTFDVSLIHDGEPTRSERGYYAGQEISVSAIDIISVGAGGGSIAWTDRGERLKIGPQSAGARPGPACYGRGGTLPTVTDANLVLGRLNPVAIARGDVALHADAAGEAFNPVSRELGLAQDETCAGALRVVDASMADAIHSQTVARGVDPRDFTLFAFGGGGPLHAARIAMELGVRRVIIPQLGSVFSAYGIVASDIEHVHHRTVNTEVEQHEVLADVLAELSRLGNDDLDVDGVATAQRTSWTVARLRFHGQLHTVEVPVPSVPWDAEAARELRTAFVARYERLFGVGTSSPEAGVEVVSLTVTAVGRTVRPELLESSTGTAASVPNGQRKTWVGDRFTDVDVFDGAPSAGSHVMGPALIDLAGSTVWVPPDVRCDVDRLGNIELTIPMEEPA